MNDKNCATNFTLEHTAAVLIRCFWMGMAVVTLWFVGFLAGGQWGYEFHQPLWSGLTRHEFDLINLCGMAIVKVLVFVGFLFPYLGIRMVLNG
jgi:hypothetical protein